MWRAEGGVGLAGEYGFFKETKSSVEYENSMYGYGVDVFGRAGVRIGSVAFGIAAAADAATGSLGRRTSTTVGANPTYEYKMFQGLAGGFIGVTFGGNANGPELFGEYYALAHRSVSTAEARTGNPFKDFDTLNGEGWGAGFSFTWDTKNRAGLLYRNLMFYNVNISGTADPVTRTDPRIQTLMIFLSSRL